MRPRTRNHSEAEQAAAYFAGQCRKILSGRIPDGAPVTTTILAHGDGGFSAQAFYTVWSDTDRKDFAREVVSYNSYRDGSDGFVHGVEHYYSGHHEEHNFHELAQIDDPNA